MSANSKILFSQARGYIKENARQIDRRLFAYHFEDEAAASVIDALARYQNHDGGFGNALEPDLRTPASSVIATSTGLSILREVSAPASDPLVQRAIAYLLDNYDETHLRWPIIPPAANDAPRAWWWDFDKSEYNFGGFLINPRAAIIGHLQNYAPLVPTTFLNDLTERVVSHMESLPDEMSLNDTLCLIGLAEAANLPHLIRNRIVSKLSQVVRQSVIVDPEKWGEYCLQPLDIAPHPNSLLVHAIALKHIESQLFYDIVNQLPDGSWSLPWSWAELDPVAWAMAEREWKGHEAVNKLRILRDWGRITPEDQTL